MISLTSLDIFDLALRFAAIGQLFILILSIQKYRPLPHRLSAQALTICIIAYILLTTRIPNLDYGWLRSPLLLLTDLTAFAVLLFSQTQLHPNLQFKYYPKWIVLPLLAWCTWLVYFFLLTDGNGILHDANHALGLVILLFVIYRCLAGYLDDLVDSRRNIRLILVAGCGVYMAMLTLFEFVQQSVRDSWQFSLFNAVLIFILSEKITMNFIDLQPSVESGELLKKTTPDPKSASLPGENLQLIALKKLMATSIYRQHGFTISRLAEELGVPQHQLRQLINNELGFTNFSNYINSYRIPDICQQLQDSKIKHIPILTLALDAGYGSVATFNRAFKQQMGKTPTEYRDQF
jgi:AraC-like DNA-binding protein